MPFSLILRGDAVAVFGVQHDPIRQRLDAIGERGQGRQCVHLRVRGVEPHFDDLARRVLGDEVPGRALGHDAAAVHDDEPVAQLLGLVHVVGREHERRAGLLQPVQALPHEVTRLRIEAGGGLVEQQQLGLVDERACDREPALHATRQRVDLRVAPVGQLHEIEQLLGALLDERTRQVEVAAVDEQVVPDGELGVVVVLLRDHADAAADRRAGVLRVEAEHPELAGRDRRHASDHPHRRALARAVRTEEPERFARLDREVDAVDRDERSEFLGQRVRFDERPGGHDGRRYRFAESVLVGFRAALVDALRRPLARVDLVVGPVGLLRGVRDVEHRPTVGDLDDRRDQIRVGRGNPAFDVVAQDLGESFEHAADHVLLLARERTARTVGNGRHPVRHRVEIDGARLGTPDAIEETGECESVALAGRALAARLHREEASDAVRDGGEVVSVVEEHEAGRAEPAPRIAASLRTSPACRARSPGGTGSRRR